jgi:hypothetical protein
VLLDVSIRFRIDVLDERAAHRIGLTHATDSGTDSPR